MSASPFALPSPTSFADYKSSTVMYALLSVASLQERVLANLPPEPDGAKAKKRKEDAEKHLNAIIQEITFEPVPYADPKYLTGTAKPGVEGTGKSQKPVNDYPYLVTQDKATSASPATPTTPLLGFRIGQPPVAGTPQRRVVITAGMHGAELAPPRAVVNFFERLVVNYVCFKLNQPFETIIHPAFDYQAGRLHTYKDSDAGELVAGPNPFLSPDKVQAGGAAGSNSPGGKKPVNVLAYSFPAPMLRRILEEVEIILLPVVNPSGLDFVVTDPATVFYESTDPEDKERELLARQRWRKTRSPLPAGTFPTPTTTIATMPDLTPDDIKTSIYGTPDAEIDTGPKTGDSFTTYGVKFRPIGVDINRNANFAWNPAVYYNAATYSDLKGTSKKSGAGNSANPYNFAGYRGPAANSEGETRAVLAALTCKTLAGMKTAQKTTFADQADRSQESSLPPTDAYTGSLFYLDVHAFGRTISTPWGTETPGNVPDQTFLNTAKDGQRDGPKGAAYKEYMPDKLYFGSAVDEAKQKPYDLLAAHTTVFGESMKQAINDAMLKKAVLEELPPPVPSPSPSVPLTPTEKILSAQSTYQVQTATTDYITPGTPVDYALGLNIRGIAGATTPTGVALNKERTGPVIALTIEVGSVDDGLFAPVNSTSPEKKEERGTTYYTQGQYSKVERETFAALFRFLEASRTYTPGQTK